MPAVRDTQCGNSCKAHMTSFSLLSLMKSLMHASHRGHAFLTKHDRHPALLPAITRKLEAWRPTLCYSWIVFSRLVPLLAWRAYGWAPILKCIISLQTYRIKTRSSTAAALQRYLQDSRHCLCAVVSSLARIKATSCKHCHSPTSISPHQNSIISSVRPRQCGPTC